VVVGAGAFAIGIGAPLLMDAAPVLSQGYAFAFFLLVYGGIALGIRRYRLFELGDWAFRILFYTAGAVLILLLDALLIWLLHLDHQPALGLSLLLVGFIWLPLRDALWRRMNKKRQFSKDALFTAAMGVAFGITRGERAERWQRLLRQLFDPLEISTLESAVSKVTVAMDGLEMHLPPVADSPALRLRYPFAGKDLFGPSELKLALQFVALITQAETSRDAYNRGVTEERQRIAQDLHDDVGARLLSGIHGADERTRPLLHAALSDIRSIVSGLSGEGSTLDQVLIEARHEAARRLEAAGIALAWPAWLEGAEQVVLDYAPAKALHSSLREIVSNIIRHAAATQVHAQLTLRGQSLELQIRDDGCGLPVDEPKRKGYGLDNIRRRIESVGGQLRFSSHPGQGTHVEITLPLPAGPTRTRTSAAIAVK
jgi:two-component system sensor histidine kinase DevS